MKIINTKGDTMKESFSSSRTISLRLEPFLFFSNYSYLYSFRPFLWLSASKQLHKLNLQNLYTNLAINYYS